LQPELHNNLIILDTSIEINKKSIEKEYSNCALKEKFDIHDFDIHDIHDYNYIFKKW